MLHVLLFIPAHDPDPSRWMVVMWAYCVRRGYHPQAVVHTWGDVRKLMLDGAAQKVVVARREHVDWLEVVTEDPRVESRPELRRPQRRRKREEPI